MSDFLSYERTRMYIFSNNECVIKKKLLPLGKFVSTFEIKIFSKLTK